MEGEISQFLERAVVPGEQARRRTMLRDRGRAAPRQRGLETWLPSAALAMLALSALAFWPGYLSRVSEADGYTHVHAALGTLWLLLLVAQPVLIRAGERTAHRWLGRFACVAGATFVVASLLLTHHRLVQMDPAKFAREGHAFYLPLAMAAIFAASLALGARWRSSFQVHGRFMACTLLPLLDPVLARLAYFHLPPFPAVPMYQLPAFLLVVFALFLLSATLSRNAPGRSQFLAFVAGTTIALLLYFATPYSAAWLRFLAWFRSLPLT